MQYGKLMRVLIVLVFAGVAYAQPTLIAHTIAQCKTGNTALTTGTACGGSAHAGAAIDVLTTPASLIVACGLYFTNGGAHSGSVIDSKSNTWTTLGTGYVSSNIAVQLYYFIPTTRSQLSTTYTVTFPAVGPGEFTSGAVLAFAGTAAATVLRAATDTGGALGSNLSITPTAANDLLVSCISDDSNTAKTINGGFSTPVESQPTTGTSTTDGETGNTSWQAAPNTTTITWAWNNATSGVQNGAAFAVGPAPAAASGSLTPAHSEAF